MLKTTPPYEFGFQVSIVLVYNILHNFILQQNVEIGDEDTTSIQGSENEPVEDDNLIIDEISRVPSSSNSLPPQVMRSYTQREWELWQAFRDNLAIKLWEEFTGQNVQS